MKFLKKISKEKILSYILSLIISIVVIVFISWLFEKINFFKQISKIFLIVIIFTFEIILFFIVLQKIIYQYFLYKKKIFGEMFKYKIIVYVVFNLGIIFFIFTSFIIYFNFNKQRRQNYYKINSSLESTYSKITELIGGEKENYLKRNKEIIKKINNLNLNLKLNSKSNSDSDSNKNENYQLIVIEKRSISFNHNKKIEKLINLIQENNIIFFSIKLNNKKLDVINQNYLSFLKLFYNILNKVNNKNIIIEKIKDKYFIFLNNNNIKYVYYPEQKVYLLNEKLYPGYIKFKAEFSIFKYTPVLYILYFLFIFIPILFLQIFFTINFINKLNKPLKILLTSFEKLEKFEIEDLKNYKIYNEFYFLLNKFNVMQKEINKNQIYKRYKDRYEIYKIITTKFAHEIKNPLTPITLSAQLIKKKYPYNDDFKEYVNKKIEIILDNSKIIKNIIEKIYNFSNDKKLDSEQINLKEFLDSLKNTWDSEKVKINIDFNFNVDILVKANLTDFYSIFNNLIINSINAKNTLCEIAIRVKLINNNDLIDKLDSEKYYENLKNEDNKLKNKIEHYKKNDSGFEIKSNLEDVKGLNNRLLIIDYYDNGPGIPKDIQKFIFEPFFTTNLNGSGLGLAIIRSTIQKYNGSIKYIDDHEGAHFRIVINI